MWNWNEKIGGIKKHVQRKHIKEMQEIKRFKTKPIWPTHQREAQLWRIKKDVAEVGDRSLGRRKYLCKNQNGSAQKIVNIVRWAFTSTNEPMALNPIGDFTSSFHLTYYRFWPSWSRCFDALSSLGFQEPHTLFASLLAL